MMKMKTKPTGLSPMINGSSTPGAGGYGQTGAHEWEMRPGGMLVQKRNPDSDRTSVPPPTLRVRVKYGSIYHDIYISSQATFGELKKMLTGPTGLHHEDQKLMYKDKERDSKAFLDITGVKDRSKLVLVEDPISQEKRLIEMRKNAKKEKASKSISEISLEVDRLGNQVSALEKIIDKGKKVTEKDVLHLIEQLMNQLLKLDGIMADGDVKLQRKMQVKRVQKYVETLDVLKIKNSMGNNSNGGQNPIQNQERNSNGQRLPPIYEHQPPRSSTENMLIPTPEQKPRHSVESSRNHYNQPRVSSSSSGPVVTTKWETFDSTPTHMPITSPSTSTSVTSNQVPHKFNWEFFD